ncbi:hypothetical protein CFHF_26180 [Caulobacter flavus]|jgi:hypothetical protein|uniref:Uncharacterized protein n=1 Tax=Caulobacter flavus TaxID=1679497 RepID=A0A2N5CKL3_9CAUL|nr:hypothetical protein [Caulobacter flavus]AYV47892.1 hypothetical protein C1707_17405 [Caulobacter flavus]PLR06031.1 hypothetical protein CFHF_26180 [Caulobacter flavus]
MPKSKPPRSRLRRAPNGKPVERSHQRTIAACDDIIERLQKITREVESVAHEAPAEELANFREEMAEGVRCWTSVRNIHLEAMSGARKPAWPGIVKAMEAAEARAKRL